MGYGSQTWSLFLASLAGFYLLRKLSECLWDPTWDTPVRMGPLLPVEAWGLGHFFSPQCLFYLFELVMQWCLNIDLWLP